MSAECCRKSRDPQKEPSIFGKGECPELGQKVLPDAKAKKKVAHNEMPGFSENGQIRDSQWSRNNPNYKCGHEDRRNRAELKRRKFIEKLRRRYEISVEGIDENVTNEIIRKVEFIEKENRERERRHAEKTLYILTRLLEEQKSKRRGLTFLSRTKQKKLKTNLPSFPATKTNAKEKSEDKNAAKKNSKENFVESNFEKEPQISNLADQEVLCSNETKDIAKKEGTDAKPIECFEKIDSPLEGEFTNAYNSSLTSLQSIPLEKCLESTPKKIMFQDYEKGEVYLQVIKITNISMETVHCRYLGIAVHSKHEGRFPIGVAVRDSVKLRPGLSCSTKIRLCYKEEPKELECSIVYETRRLNQPLKHSFFFVPVSCLPVRAIVRVSPLKIRFPCLSWCVATGPEASKLLNKIIRIENTGGKECFCKIVQDTDPTVNEEESEEENSVVDGSKSRNFNGDHESKLTEDENISVHEEIAETIGEILKELIDNVFATFRFSQKYHIPIAPFSTKQITIRFIPEYKGFHQETHVFQFEGSYNRSMEIIELTGDIKKLPLAAEPQLIDLKTCVMNSGVYAATFNVRNTGRGPISICAKIPRALKNHAHVHPKATIIQSSSFCQFSVRFYPRITLDEDAGRYFNKDSGVLEFPVFVHSAPVNGNCKSDYLKIYVFAIITDYSLELFPRFIDFGQVSTLETVRTRINLTNHSLSAQEFGFLNLPREVRIEPNMGFGLILPKETITLDVLYAPAVEVSGKNFEKHEFEIKVTSLAECGGFGEKFSTTGTQSSQSLWGEDFEFKCPEGTLVETEATTPETPEENGEFGDFGECYESDSSADEEMLRAKKAKAENQIRDYLKTDGDASSEHSFFKRMNFRMPEPAPEPGDTIVSPQAEPEEFPGENMLNWFPGPDAGVIKCEAIVTEPRCQLSASVIQLPPTPCSSFSMYRLRLKSSNERTNTARPCGLRLNKEKNSSFRAAFEFKCDSSKIQLEPQCGFFKSGETVAITVIHKPELPPEELCHEARVLKGQRLLNEKPKDVQAVSKDKKSTRNNKKNVEGANSESANELEKYDLFAAEQKLLELVSPYHGEVKVTCIVNIENGGIDEDNVEIHDLVLVCPVTKPKFVYNGTSQEINFDKVYVGTKARLLIEIKNISLERIRPMVSLLNPVGPFSCLSALRKVPLDPEHILRQPVIYSPSEKGGFEKENLEIFCGSTSFCLVVKGEGIVPKCNIIPSYACFLIESKSGSAEELKLDIENLNALNLQLRFVVVYTMQGLDACTEPHSEEVKKENVQRKGDSKKKAESEKRNLTGWDEIPESILMQMKKFEEVESEKFAGIFTITGLDNKGEIQIPSNGKGTVKIKFTSPPIKNEKDSNLCKKYAIKYKITLGNSVVALNEILIIGVASKPKDK